MKCIGNIRFVSTANDDIIKRIKQNEHPKHPDNKLDKDETLIVLTKLDIEVSGSCSFLINNHDVLEVSGSHTTSDNFRVVEMSCLTGGATVNLTYEYGDYYTIPKSRSSVEGGGTGGGSTGGSGDSGLTSTQIANINKIPGIISGETTIYNDLTAHKNNTAIHHTHSNKVVLDGITAGKVAQWDSAVGEELYPSDLLSTVVNPMGGFAEGDVLYGKTLAEILEVLLCINENVQPPEPPVGDVPAFAGMRDYFVDPQTFTYDSLMEITKGVPVMFPQTVYAHSGPTAYAKQVLCAVPKSLGTITSVVDGAGISIKGAYPIFEKTIEVPNVGPVVYSISASVDPQMYNANTVVKFNIV